jgi:hypothetical protein
MIFTLNVPCPRGCGRATRMGETGLRAIIQFDEIEGGIEYE